MARRRRSGELYYIPLNIDLWRKMTALLSLEEKGALIEAAVVAFSAPARGHPPGTLPDDEDALELLLGRRSRVAYHLIRQHFRPDLSTPGFLVSLWVKEAYESALGRYQAQAEGGRAAARTRGKRSPRPAPLFENDAKQDGTLSVTLKARSAYAERHAESTQPKPNVVLTTHNGGAASNARQERPDTAPLRPLSDLVAWEMDHPDHAAAAEAELEKLCGTWPSDQQPSARRLFRHRALDAAFASLTSPSGGGDL